MSALVGVFDVVVLVIFDYLHFSPIISNVEGLFSSVIDCYQVVIVISDNVYYSDFTGFIYPGRPQCRVVSPIGTSALWSDG